MEPLYYFPTVVAVSENKVLCHPASVDSLSTSAGTEDHVSMGGYAARKSLQVLDNVERVIAIELLAACQAIEFLRPLKTTVPLEEVYNVVRSSISSLLGHRVSQASQEDGSLGISVQLCPSLPQVSLGIRCTRLLAPG
uniref:Histidine ammonia-lyase n=1 Tax=Timema poppense TaxID=170557 RepID=A0A7R9DVN5_TIMPO|nr:unnamed protein product [Timema poppensis]